MYELKVLIVDDEDWPHDAITAHIERAKHELGLNVRVVSAHTRGEAVQQMKRVHFDLALVDLHLDDDSRTDGIEVLNELRSCRPSCRRVAMTDKTRPEEKFPVIDEVFVAVNPNQPLCDGVINKRATHDVIERTIREFVERLGTQSISWTTADIRLINKHVKVKVIEKAEKAEKAERARSKASGGRVRPIYTQHELEAVLSALMGRADRRGRSFDGPVLSGVTDRFAGRTARFISIPDSGRSRSVVFFARSELSRGQPGAVLVIKVASRDDIIEEAGRYNLFLRFGARHALRPDLLSWVTADTIGALAYSFGGTPDEENPMPDLERVVVALSNPDTDPSTRDELQQRMHQALRHVVGPSTASWYVNGFDPDIGMVPLVQLDVNTAIKHLVEFAGRLQKAIPGIFRVEPGTHEAEPKPTSRRGATEPPSPRVRVGHRVEVPGQPDLLLPDRRSIDMLDVQLRGQYRACIVHGDLNLSNVLIEPGRPDCMLIDFRHSGPGPRLYDYATAAVHARLVEAKEHAKVGQDIASDLGWFKEVLKDEQRAWNDKKLVRPWRDPDGWSAAMLNRYLFGLLLETFKDDQIPVGNDLEREFQATTLLYALRMLMIDSLDNTERTRLLITVAVTFKRLIDG
jgi:DNA-binding NarL/FixJ family response regulator